MLSGTYPTSESLRAAFAGDRSLGDWRIEVTRNGTDSSAQLLWWTIYFIGNCPANQYLQGYACARESSRAACGMSASFCFLLLLSVPGWFGVAAREHVSVRLPLRSGLHRNARSLHRYARNHALSCDSLLQTFPVQMCSRRLGPIARATSQSQSRCRLLSPRRSLTTSHLSVRSLSRVRMLSTRPCCDRSG